jgi:UDP-N-acetylmuramate dehydrogenase
MDAVSDFGGILRDAFGADRVRTNVPLAPFTTFKVGGPAEWFVETRTSGEISRAVALAHQSGVNVTMLGGGSNVLIADGGIRGLVIRARGGSVADSGPDRIRADAAVSVNGLVRWTIGRGYRGLEEWAGTPGTVGGAIFGNAHFASRLIGELVEEVRLVSRDGVVIDLPGDAMAFGYDRSRLQHTGEVLLSAVFRISHGDPVQLRAAARRSLAYRKATQPLDTPNAGCVFQNPDPERDSVPDGGPWSAGALIDRVGLKGSAVGAARVSPVHGNFIVNQGGATAREVRALISRCREAVRVQFGIELREEILYLGDHDDVID